MCFEAVQATKDPSVFKMKGNQLSASLNLASDTLTNLCVLKSPPHCYALGCFRVSEATLILLKQTLKGHLSLSHHPKSI